MHPPPSSVEPVPTSHESKWPPTTTISSGRLAAADLADDVEGVGVGQEPRLHPQPQADPGAAVLHPLQPLGVLGRHRRGRESSAARRRSGARRCAASAGPAGPTDADQHRDRAARRRARRAVAAIGDGLAVGRERHVEEDDAALDAIARRRRAPRSCGRRADRPRRRRPACRRCCRGRASPAAAGPARRFPGFRRRAPSAAPSPVRARTFSRPSRFICSAAHLMAASRFSEPLSRWPKVSPSSASRCQAKRRRPRFADQAARRLAVRRRATAAGALARGGRRPSATRSTTDRERSNEPRRLVHSIILPCRRALGARRARNRPAVSASARASA